jgi:hypothetical protein
VGAGAGAGVGAGVVGSVGLLVVVGAGVGAGFWVVSSSSHALALRIPTSINDIKDFTRTMAASSAWGFPAAWDDARSVASYRLLAGT